MSFVAALAWARAAAPLALLMECVDGLPDHPHFPIILAAIQWAGYRVHHSLVHDHATFGPCARRRWLATLLRCDVEVSEPAPTASFGDPVPAPWTHQDYQGLMTRFSGTIPTLPSCLVPILTCTLRKRSSRGGWPLLISHCARSVLGTLSSMSWLLLPWLTGGFVLSSPLMVAASSLPHSGLCGLELSAPLSFLPWRRLSMAWATVSLSHRRPFRGLSSCVRSASLLRYLSTLSCVCGATDFGVLPLRPAVVRGWYFVGALDQLIDFAFHPQTPVRADAEGQPVVVGEEAFPRMVFPYHMGAARSILHSPSGLRVEVTYPVGASVFFGPTDGSPSSSCLAPPRCVDSRLGRGPDRT